ncbi:MAG: SDR family oxidoreductase [Chromatiales bacterium]|jgi:2-hydroxycyclohexanecarboxyl-CoA dehydrogenase|nr:SDR family oxidoreductase [Chromatiales bacterium]
MKESKSGRVAIVTGAGSGIGRAIAYRLAADGMAVAVADINFAGAKETVAHIGDGGFDALAVHMDVTDEDSVKVGVEEARQRFGEVLVAVSNAGITGGGVRFHDETKDHFLRQLSVHTHGAFHLLRETIGPMREARWGRIVVTASIAATIGYPGGSSYGAAKGALVGLVRTVALENMSRGVTANCVLPGIIETPVTLGFSAERRAKMFSNNPARRPGKPEDIAGAVSYLCSDDGNYVTGQSLSPNGGLWFS